jgi:tetratricopeptide (TPR) repeat protein
VVGIPSSTELGEFCLLMRREVYQAVAPLVARGGECSEWCGLARAAGFELLVALDVFVGRSPPHPQPLSPEYRGEGSEGGAMALVAGGAESHSKECGHGLDGSAARPRVSLCMIVKDEEDNLPDCLASVAGLTDEIIIVDTGSTDRTRDIAVQAGAKVFDFPWVDDFAAARNESISHATGEWIFWMDADDRLDEDNRQKLRRLFDKLRSEEIGGRSEQSGSVLPPHSSLLTPHSFPLTPHSCFVMKCLCLPDHQAGTATVVDHVRLFRNDSRIRWKYRIHEQILSAVRQAGGEARWSDVVIQHVGYQDAARVGPKLERSARLLQLDLAENPDDPFTLFNLGWTLLKMARSTAALPYLEGSVERSQPGHSIVRKAYALLVECHKGLGDMDKALALCRRGRRLYPDDAEIIFEEGCLHLTQGNLPAAESLFIQLVETKAGTYFASVDPALHGYKSRHCLGEVYHKQRRYALAESQWRAVLAERADYLPTLMGLGELYLTQEEWEKVDEMVHRLATMPAGQVESTILRAQKHMARHEFGPAKDLLAEAKQRFPNSLLPRVVFSHALLQEDRDLDAAETALREVLTMDPNHLPTRHNLHVLMHKRGLLAAC